jgi:hypothetical protein
MQGQEISQHVATPYIVRIRRFGVASSQEKVVTRQLD